MRALQRYKEVSPFTVYSRTPAHTIIACEQTSFFRNKETNFFYSHQVNLGYLNYDKDGNKLAEPIKDTIDNYVKIRRYATAEDRADYIVKDNFSKWHDETITKEELTSELIKSPVFKDYILGDHPIVGCFLSGSYSLGLQNNLSDFDVCCLTLEDFNNKEDTQSDFSLSYKGKHIHWYYIPIKNLSYEWNETYCYGLIELQNLHLEDFFYRAPQYAQELEKIWAQIPDLVQLGAKRAASLSDRLVQVLLQTKENFSLSKRLLYSFYASYVLQGEVITDHKDFLLSFRSKENKDELTPEEEEIMYQHLSFLANLNKNN